MELIQAIALLCQVAHSASIQSHSTKYTQVWTAQLQCQQSYLNCVSKRRSTMSEKDALEKCILEK